MAKERNMGSVDFSGRVEVVLVLFSFSLQFRSLLTNGFGPVGIYLLGPFSPSILAVEFGGLTALLVTGDVTPRKMMGLSPESSMPGL